VLTDGRIVLVRQYRHAAGNICGNWSPGEWSPAKIQRRERSASSLKETGYRAKKFSIFLDHVSYAGILEERMFLPVGEG